jgi:type IV pilus assembly protein PilB
MKNHPISDALRLFLPAEFAQRKRIVPIECRDNLLRIGFEGDADSRTLRDVEFLTGMAVEPVRLTEQELSEGLERLYGNEIPVHSPVQSDLGEFQVLEKQKEKSDNGDLRRELDERSVVSLVNQIITNAIDSRASDIHIESYEGEFRVRYRRDGVLQEAVRPPLEKKLPVISRLKIMADLDIAEKRRPQDGRIRVRRHDHVIDIRVSTLPTDFGEKVVLRILDKSQLNLDFGKLGFDKKTLDLYQKAAASPYGMILVTGPTGSGKTTTLYATLNYLNSPEVNILTIEDPIEYNLNGINQSQVKADIGFTFARALRSFLRQDPDVIMVGEIRDQETAEIAIRAALTGHLVLSTLHTNSAPDTLTRLIDMEQEPFLISSSVKMVVAQRLLRTVCERCRTVDRDKAGLKRLTGVDSGSLRKVKLAKGKGCGRCGGTGYFGRTAVFEAMPISSGIARAVNRRADSRELKSIACGEGMRTLQESAIDKLKEGITTIEEVLRETEA